MKNYTVWDFKEQRLNWDIVEPLIIENYPWYMKGKKQLTTVKMALSKRCIHISVDCEDAHSSAQVTEFNGSVCEDSCFEFFLTPNEKRGSAYLNFEINCCKTLHLGYGMAGGPRNLVSKNQGSRVEIESSIIGPTKEEQADDRSWQLKVVIPIDLIEEISGESISKTLWYGNFYRCGGKTEPQFATWQPIISEQPAFHKPKQFGELSIKDWENQLEVEI